MAVAESLKIASARQRPDLSERVGEPIEEIWPLRISETVAEWNEWTGLGRYEISNVTVRTAWISCWPGSIATSAAPSARVLP
jgi:hypothetical protein